MDGYPAGSLDHNVPLLVASGFNVGAYELPLPKELKDQGILLRSERPALDTREAEVLIEYFGQIDEVGKSWVGVERDEPYRLRIKTVGRSFLLPPRRARLPEDSEPLETQGPLHSPFSPLSPVSSLYPDGLIDAQWIEKHQSLVPSVFMCFHTLTTDPTTATLQDNKLKNDIAEWKNALAKSGYKSKLAVALLSDEDSTPATMAGGLQERLENIRRGSGLEPKSLFYIPPQDSPTELKNVMDNILNALYTNAIEYYRDLGRHAKKKRSRGMAPQPSVPPTSGTSRYLSLPEWNFRYDFKSAVLAEFRQENDAALRSYEQAYEVILGQDVLETVPYWSPRFNQGRLLADVIAIRCLRLHFWMGQTSLAVRRWQTHRERISDFVERQGCGTTNYGWEAWEARWAMAMASLIDRVELSGLEPSTTALFLPPEKNVLGDRIPPWECLHHTGYWYRIAANHLTARKRYAHQMPEEDRKPRQQIPATPMAGKAFHYDTYMCPEPHEEYPLTGKGTNHSSLIIDCLILAQSQFQARHQLRIAAELSLECAKEMENEGSWNDVLAILRPLWDDTSYRAEAWLDVSEDLCWLIRRAAAEAGRGDLIVAIDWELMNKKFTRRPKWPYDFGRSLDGVSPHEKPLVKASDDELGSSIDASFVFRNKESRAGDSCIAQLALLSNAFSDATPTTLTSLRLEFDGSLKPIELHHRPSNEESKGLISIDHSVLREDFLEDSQDDLPSTLTGECDLTLEPGTTRVIELSIPLREAGEVIATSATLIYNSEAFDFEYSIKLGTNEQNQGWFTASSSKARHAREDAHILQVQPRPPKMQITVLDLLDQYYANELIDVRIELNNAEDENANVKLDVSLFGDNIPSFKVQGKGEEREVAGAVDEVKITGLPVGHLSSSSATEVRLLIDPADAPTSYDMELKATYHLEPDPATPIIQVLLVHLNVVNPFEANYDLVPRLHPQPWPSMFDCDNIQERGDVDKSTLVPQGLVQEWCLKCHYASFATEDLIVMGMDMKILSGPGDVRCNVAQEAEVGADGITISPKTMNETQFQLIAQKLSLDDRQPVALELGLVIQWRRPGGDVVNTTTMVAGRYLVLGSEPRVLASVLEGPIQGPEGSPTMMQLDITIENPSNHFLTFGLTMEPSDEFAFSGAKQTTVHLLPMTRRGVTYRLLILGKGGTYVRPGLVVRDKYFQKVLRIIPTEGMKIDQDGLLVWVPKGVGFDEDVEDVEDGQVDE